MDSDSRTDIEGIDFEEIFGKQAKVGAIEVKRLTPGKIRAVFEHGRQLAEEEMGGIKQTDNTRKEGDLEAPQYTRPLDLDGKGLPIDFYPGE